jgi:hypothetical protein
MNNMNYIGPDELIYNNDGEIHSSGFSVNSIMMKNGLSPILTLNHNNINPIQSGGSSINKVSDLFNNLVVPNWTLSYNYKNGVVYEGGDNNLKYQDNSDEKEDDIIEDTIHDKLVDLAKVDENEMKSNSLNKKPVSKKNALIFSTVKNKKTITKKNRIKLN